MASAGEGLAALIKDTKWPLLILIVLVVARRELLALLAALARRFETSRVDISLPGAGGIQIKLEGPVDHPGRITVSLYGSALDIDADRAPLAAAALADLAEHMTFHYTASAAAEWVRAASAASVAAQGKIASTQRDLKAALSSATGVKQALVAFAAALEEGRFHTAETLAELYADTPALRDEVARLQSSPDENRVRHALGVAHALRSEWGLGEEILEPLVTSSPPHLPAVGTHLCCHYNRLVHEVFGPAAATATPDPSTTFFDDLWRLIDHVERAAQGGQWPPPHAEHHRRELDCVMGIVLSQAAEVCPPSNRARWLERAEPFLERCTRPTPGEPPLARDFNNYADLLRQLRKYPEALVAIQKAHEMSARWDPAYAETYALILCGLDRRLESLLAIQEYGERQAIGGPPDELSQYLDNQLVFAKLVFRFMRAEGVNDLTRVVGVLERALAVLQVQGHRLPDVDRRQLDSSLNDALGDAYLQTVWQVDRAEEAFRAANRSPTPPESRWRRTLSLARGRLRLARLHRQNLDSGRARSERRLAEALLTGWENMRGEIPLAGVRPRRLRDGLLLHLDLLEVVQDLASESLWQGDVGSAQPLAAVIDGLLPSLQAALIGEVREALGGEHDRVMQRLVRAEARQSFLEARLVAAASRWTPATVAEVQMRLAEARRGDASWNEHMDLALGQYLMDAALRGEGDVAAWQARAVEAFERVMLSADAARRREAMRAYVDATQQRETVLERQRSLRANRS